VLESKKVSIYIHYPFCKSKCPYCDFNSYSNIKIDEEELINLYLQELNYYKNILKNRNIETIYFGGGTPSLMSKKMLSSIFSQILKLSNIEDNCEISLEANPNSITFEKLQNFKKIGINRLSIGVQSLKNEDLKFLGRMHSKEDAINSIKMAQKVFEDKYSIDLIYTRPKQNLENWKNELMEAIKLSPFHISLYQLIIEKGTKFYKNKIKLPDDDLSIEFFNSTREILEKNSLEFYEISNYAKNGYKCKHNLVYWQNGEWLGIGAGAHGRINTEKGRIAIQNIKEPLLWAKNVSKKKNGISIKSYLSKEEIINEYILMGLRIKNGIDAEKIKEENFYEILDKKNIELLENNELILANEKNIKLTKKGFLLLNSIIEKLIKL
jgi:oxygen-independent coproporphyrinogen-3 oxidase